MRVLSDSGEPGCKTAVCFLLQGSKEQVLLARCVLENLVIDCEPVTETLEVPQTAFGRIIGIFQMLRMALIPGHYSFFSEPFLFSTLMLAKFSRLMVFLAFISSHYSYSFD